MRPSFPMVRVAVVLGLCLTSISCAGVRFSVKADHIDEPVSFTPCVFDQSGRIIRPAEREAPRHFQIKRRFWAMLFSSVNLTRNDWDLSDELVREISETNGDAIVNMTVTSQKSPWWLFSIIVPFIPNYQTVVVEGDVVQVHPETAAR